jgi:hypothetical protein
MASILFADPAESAGFRRRFARRWKDDAVSLHTGFGPDLAAATLRLHLNANRPDALISSGFAAGLAPDLPPGTPVIGTPWSDPALLAQIEQAGLGLRSEPLASCREILATPDAKFAFARKSGTRIADMETEALHAICREIGCPFLSVRIVSDALHEPLPNAFLAAMQSPAAKRATAFLAAAIRSPGQWGHLARMLCRIPRLSDRLGATLDGILAAIRPNPHDPPCRPHHAHGLRIRHPNPDDLAAAERVTQASRLCSNRSTAGTAVTLSRTGSPQITEDRQDWGIRQPSDARPCRKEIDVRSHASGPTPRSA